MPSKRRPTPPDHLSNEARAFWADVAEGYELEDRHFRLLTLAAEALDRAAQARAAIEKHGLLIETGAGSLKPNPAVAIERDARIGFARLCRELDLDADAPFRDARPPALRSNRG